jgi:hypothetical protein
MFSSIRCWFSTPSWHTAAYWLKAITVEPEKQPLLANGSETTFVSTQRPRNKQWTTSVARQQILNKQIYQSRCWVTVSQINMFPWKQLNSNRGTVCSVRSELRCYIRDTFRNQLIWKRAAIQRGSEHRSREITIVRRLVATVTDRTLVRMH